jgi:hypothetical protein
MRNSDRINALLPDGIEAERSDALESARPTVPTDLDMAYLGEHDPDIVARRLREWQSLLPQSARALRRSVGLRPAQ